MKSVTTEIKGILRPLAFNLHIILTVKGCVAIIISGFSFSISFKSFLWTLKKKLKVTLFEKLLSVNL